MSDEADYLKEMVNDVRYEILRLQAEVKKLQKATTPICVGRPIIGILAREGAWTSENGASVVAADELFRNDPYEEIARLRAALKPFADRYVDDCGTGFTSEDYRAAHAAMGETE